MTAVYTHLVVYLNDHLAGAVGALEILDSLTARTDTPELSRFATELRKAIAEDYEELKAMMSRAGVEVSTGRRVAGWIGDKAAELKTYVDDPLNGALRTFEQIEVVAVGIDGKRALWAALAAAAAGIPELQSVDYSRLTVRANQQRQAIEERRLQWAITVLTKRV